LLPILRTSIAFVWIFTGIVSLGVYPVASSYELLARVGTPPALMPLSLYGAGLLDLALGFLTLRSRPPRWLWVVQASLVLIYTLIISVKIPEFWLHPYGPILKNLPFLAGLWILYELEDRAWNT
jgi:ABC-type branched-subunit amino acid transport system permease subunit